MEHCPHLLVHGTSYHQSRRTTTSTTTTTTTTTTSTTTSFVLSFGFAHLLPANPPRRSLFLPLASFSSSSSLTHSSPCLYSPVPPLSPAKLSTPALKPCFCTDISGRASAQNTIPFFLCSARGIPTKYCYGDYDCPCQSSLAPPAATVAALAERNHLGRPPLLSGRLFFFLFVLNLDKFISFPPPGAPYQLLAPVISCGRFSASSRPPVFYSALAWSTSPLRQPHVRRPRSPASDPLPRPRQQSKCLLPCASCESITVAACAYLARVSWIAPNTHIAGTGLVCCTTALLAHLVSCEAPTLQPRLCAFSLGAFPPRQPSCPAQTLARPKGQATMPVNL